jgi:hypothetical protein
VRFDSLIPQFVPWLLFKDQGAPGSINLLIVCVVGLKKKKIYLYLLRESEHLSHSVSFCTSIEKPKFKG